MATAGVVWMVFEAAEIGNVMLLEDYTGTRCEKSQEEGRRLALKGGEVPW